MKYEEWLASRRVEMTLPSGLDVILRPAALPRLARSGKIPKPLLGALRDLASENDIANINDFDALLMYYDKLPLLNELQLIVAAASLVEPELTDEQIGELDIEDLEAIFNFATQGAKAIAPFPQQPRGSGAAGRDSDAVRPETVAVVGHPQ